MERFHSVTRGMAGVLMALSVVFALDVRGAWAGPQDLVGKAAPDFSLGTVDGKTVKLSDLKGSVVLVDFWATWCGPCKKSLPHIQKLSQDKAKAKEGLKILAVNAGEEKTAVQPFLTDNKYTFTVPMDSNGNTGMAYGVEGIPTTLVIGRDGKVAAAFVGFDPENTPKEIDQAVDAALSKK